MSIWEELKRRKVIQVATVYAVVGWLLIEIATTIQPWLSLPLWFPTIVIVLLAIGFPVAVILAWAFDIGPRGIERESRAADAPRAGFKTGSFVYVSQVVIIALVGFLIADQYWLEGRVRAAADSSYKVFPITILSNHPIASSRWSEFALSRTGTHFVYRTATGISIRELSEREPRPIAGTDDVFALPILSPDGEYVAYWSTRGTLAKLSVDGGRSEDLVTSLPGINSASWGEDGYIYLTNDALGILRVSERGGEVEPLLASEPGTVLNGAYLLPDADTLLYSKKPSDASWDDAEIFAHTISEDRSTPIGVRGSDPRYVATGHVVFVVGNSLYGIVFDPASLATSGSPIELVTDLTLSTAVGSADYGISDDGILAYVSRRAEERRKLVWADREGGRSDIAVEPGNYWYAQLSPDDSLLALNGWEDRLRRVWIADLRTGARLELSSRAELEAATGVWSQQAGALRVAYTRGDEDGNNAIVSRVANRSGEPQLLHALTPQRFVIPTAFVPDRAELLTTTAGPPRSTYRIVLGDPAAEPELILGDGQHSFYNASVSPDGQWIVYQSDKTGRLEIWVRPYPDGGPGSEIQISRNGGLNPAWRRDDGSELFYLEPAGEPGIFRLMAFPVDLESSAAPFNAAAAAPILTARFFTAFSIFRNPYDVSLDGSRFVLLQSAPLEDAASGTSEILVTVGWTGRLQERLPSP